jgi:hypothetical protein
VYKPQNGNCHDDKAAKYKQFIADLFERLLKRGLYTGRDG